MYEISHTPEKSAEYVNLTRWAEDLQAELAERSRWYPDIRIKGVARIKAAHNCLRQGKYFEARNELISLDAELDSRAAIRSRFLTVTAVMNTVWIAVVMVALLNLGVNGPDTSISADHAGWFVPKPILFWSIVGACTAMFVRLGREPFSDRQEADRWLLTRFPIGVIMGVLAYLMVRAGLLVLVGAEPPEHPEFLWIIAFMGSFSDTLSINLLEGLLGRVQSQTQGERAKP